MGFSDDRQERRHVVPSSGRSLVLGSLQFARDRHMPKHCPFKHGNAPPIILQISTSSSTSTTSSSTSTISTSSVIAIASSSSS
jgi:hypothetical protein